MTAIPSLNELWKEEKCPLVDGVLFDDGTVLEFSVTDSPSGRLLFDVKRKTDIKEILGPELDNYTHLYHSRLNKIHGPHRYMAGEGSWGGDGYVACLDLKTNAVLWVFTSDKINPIVGLDFSNGRIMATNNWSTLFSIDINYSDQKAIVIVESDSSKAERNN
ncbi:MAG: hypothetical protein ACJASQ_001283 [Crocinitomicaceae bacterium]|jgi:hypothetical protein